MQICIRNVAYFKIIVVFAELSDPEKTSNCEICTTMQVITNQITIYIKIHQNIIQTKIFHFAQRIRA